MRRPLNDRARLVALALLALYVVMFSAIGIRQHDAFLTHKEDLGQIDQAVWNSLHGRLLVETDDDHQSTRLTDHAEPSLVFSSLIFLLWDDVRALLIWQALAAALGGWAIYLLARDVFASPLSHETREGRGGGEDPLSHETREGRGGGKDPLSRETGEGWGGGRSGGQAWLPVLFLLTYLLFPALEAAQLVEFHAAPLAVAPIAFALLFLERRQWGRFVLACLLVSAIKEEMALVGVMFGLAGLTVALLDMRRASGIAHPVSRITHPGLRAGSLVLVLSLVWFILTTFIIIPHFGAAKYGTDDSVYFQRYGELGNSPGAVVRTLFTNPALVVKVLSEPDRLGYLGGLLASAGFLALAAPWALLISGPLLGANLLSSFQAQYSGDFHYSAPLVPFFVVAAIHGFKNIQARLSGKRVSAVIIVAALVCVLVYHYERGYSPLSQNFYWPAITPHDQLFARFAAQIPVDARLSATPPLFPHLSHREFIYDFPVTGDADYIMLDASGVTDMHPNDFRGKVNTLLSGGQYGVADSADGYILLKRGASANALPDAFFDFARAPGAKPQYALDVTFGDAVRLLGYDVIPDPRWHLMQVRTYWQALRPLDADLRVYPFYHDAAGKVIEDTTARPMLATLWYPPSSWKVGETIQTETLPWDVGNSFMLATGVLHGNDWDRTGRRLITPTGETQVEMGAYAWQGKRLVRK